jgi:Na+/H+-dicarboxylate symporter
MLRYLASLSIAKMVLWCYLLWYLVTVACFFDPTPTIWLNSVGISALMGFALILSVGGMRHQRDRWTTFRLFLMPFCVSSFSSLIKGKGYVLVIPPDRTILLLSVGVCAAFVVLVQSLKWVSRRHAEV